MQLTKLGIKIVSATEPIENSPAGEFIETLLAASARFDNFQKSQRTLDGLKKRVEAGWHPGRPPLGYKTKQTDDGKNIVVKNQYFSLCKTSLVRNG